MHILYINLEIYDVPMKFACKLFHREPVHLFYRPLWLSMYARWFSDSLSYGVDKKKKETPTNLKGSALHWPIYSFAMDLVMHNWSSILFSKRHLNPITCIVIYYNIEIKIPLSKDIAAAVPPRHHSMCTVKHFKTCIIYEVYVWDAYQNLHTKYHLEHPRDWKGSKSL